MVIDDLMPLVSSRVWKRADMIIPRIFKMERYNGLVTAYVLGSDPDEVHTANIDTMGNYFCSCQGFLSHDEKLCSHLFALLKKMEMEGCDIRPFVLGLTGFGDMKMNEIKTSLKGYNQLFTGLHKKRINAIYGMPGVGKSILDMQFAIDTIEAEEGNALIWDSEGGVEPEWLSYFIERDPNLSIERVTWPTEEMVNSTNSGTQKSLAFNYNDVKYNKTKKDTIYLMECRTLLPLLAFHGRPMSLKAAGGVIEPIDDVSNLVSMKESPIGKLVEECNIKYIGYDSISNPIESEFTGGQVNWRTRAKTTFALLNRTQQMLDNYNIVAMLIIHATQGGFNKPTPVGGKSLLHNSKYILYVGKTSKTSGPYKGSKSLRNLQIFRHQLKESWSESAETIITGKGFKDI